MLKCLNRHRSKSIWVTKLPFYQNNLLKWESFWQKDSLVNLLFWTMPIMIFRPISNFGDQSLRQFEHWNHPRVWWRWSSLAEGRAASACVPLDNSCELICSAKLENASLVFVMQLDEYLRWHQFFLSWICPQYIYIRTVRS